MWFTESRGLTVIGMTSSETQTRETIVARFLVLYFEKHIWKLSERKNHQYLKDVKIL